MYVVSTGYNTNDKHSAWSDFDDAQHQLETLENNGYDGIEVNFDEDCDVEDGHYFV